MAWMSFSIRSSLVATLAAKDAVNLCELFEVRVNTIKSLVRHDVSAGSSAAS
jgi:hypothetical protein